MLFGRITLFGSRTLFTKQENRNILVYICGIMLYKFGIEAFNGAIITLATNRYDQDAHNNGELTRTFEKVGLLIGLNQAAQCFGSILISPLIKHWKTQVVLSATIFFFAFSTAIFMILDGTTGGTIKPRDFQPKNKNDFSYYGKYSTDLIIPIYFASGIAFGMVESIRRVIPANIVGDDVNKLRKMDALVHVFYEIAGVSGALMTALILIPRLGNNYAFIVTPILFACAGAIWLSIRSAPNETNESENTLDIELKPLKGHFFRPIARALFAFLESLFVGAKIVFTSRKFLWLFAAYPLAVYSHRYIENSIAPQVARRYLHQADWSQILVGGSNFGELLGALFVFIFSDSMKSPLLWVRIDAIALLVMWYIPFYNPPVNDIRHAWLIAATLIPVGFASAVGDISLDSYIQSSLTRLESKNKDVSPLGAVMAFLYSTYIIIHSIANPFLGRYIDKAYNRTEHVHSALLFTVAVQLTISFSIMFASTFVPKGSFGCNPVLIEDDDDDDDEKSVSRQTSNGEPNA